MCVSLLPVVIVESVFTDFAAAKFVILLYYVQKLRNQIYELTAIMSSYTGIQRKYSGSLAPCRPCTIHIVYIWQVIYR